jgi:hypothetical protein
MIWGANLRLFEKKSERIEEKLMKMLKFAAEKGIETYLWLHKAPQKRLENVQRDVVHRYLSARIKMPCT